MKKTLSGMIYLLFTMTATPAAEIAPYQHTGIVTSAPGNGTVVISHQVYLVDPDTRMHGPIPGGELGPTPTIGSEVGFNLQLRDHTHYITDLWLLDNDD